MKQGNKLQSVVCLGLIAVMVIGIWKGPWCVRQITSRESEVSAGLVQAASTKTEEMRAVWISFLDFQSAKVEKKSEAQFRKYVNSMFDRCVSAKLNTVIVQVRPLSDAMYASKYFPWSMVASGKQGKSPGYDPLEIMVQAAHKRNLSIEAWVNPYRITLPQTKVSSLTSKNPAIQWKNSKDASKRRNVLSFGGQLYFNPAKKEVRKLIVNGVKEIVENYDVDGIHFDDYFYPTLGSKYKNVFDAKEYRVYKKQCDNNGETAKSIVEWRRNNVDILLKEIYSQVKKIDSDVTFGVSPAGNINNLYAVDRYYSDVKKWMSKSGYVDYVCPQIYWSFSHKVCPYTSTVKRWSSIKKNNKVKLYIGLAAYRAGISKSEARKIGDLGWSESKSVLKKQVIEARKVKGVSGFVLFRYDNIVRKKTKKEMKNLKSILQ